MPWRPFAVGSTTSPDCALQLHLFPVTQTSSRQKYPGNKTLIKMSDDEADPELLELLRQSLGLGSGSADAPPNTRVLESAEFIYDNSISVSIVSGGTKAAASSIWRMMQEKGFSTKTWSDHELHPKAKDESTINFIFTMDLLNFSFWSVLDEQKRFQVTYQGNNWTGYMSLVAILQRALEEGESGDLVSLWLDVGSSR